MRFFSYLMVLMTAYGCVGLAQIQFYQEAGFEIVSSMEVAEATLYGNLPQKIAEEKAEKLCRAHGQTLQRIEYLPFDHAQLSRINASRGYEAYIMQSEGISEELIERSLFRISAARIIEAEKIENFGLGGLLFSLFTGGATSLYFGMETENAMPVVAITVGVASSFWFITLGAKFYKKYWQYRENRPEEELPLFEGDIKNMYAILLLAQRIVCEINQHFF